MYGQPETDATPLGSADWERNEDYLYAVDLFNHGFYWEAHVYWERLWQVADAGSPERALLQALVQLAAGCVKKTAAEPGGGVKSFTNAARNVERVRAQVPNTPFMGLDLRTLLVATEAETPLIELSSLRGANP